MTEEYQDYQLSPTDDLPEYDKETTRFDTFWLAMEKQQFRSGKHRFGLLSKIALSALSLPHSNADAERSFSILRKIQQDSRGNLNHQTTTSLMSCKMNEDLDCHAFKPSVDLLRKAKTVCSEYKAQHSKV